MIQLHKRRVMRSYLPIILGVLCIEAACLGGGGDSAVAAARAAPQPTTAKSEAVWIRRVRQAVPKGWSLKCNLSGKHPSLRVLRDDPIGVVYSSPIAMMPQNQTLGITVIVGPKVTPVEHERMVRYNADLRRKFRGNWGTMALISPLPWWDQRTQTQTNRPNLLPTHFDDNNSFRIYCPPLQKDRYEFKAKGDADEAAGVFAAIASRFKSHAAAGTQPATTKPAAAPLEIVCRPQFDYINKRQHLTINCDFKNTTAQPVSISWGKPRVSVWPGALNVSTSGGEQDRRQVIVQPARKVQKTVDIVLGRDCPYLDEGPWQIKLNLRTTNGNPRHTQTACRLQVEVRPSGAAAWQIVAAAAEFRRQSPSWKGQHKRIDLKRWEINWWSDSHWSVSFSKIAGGANLVEIDKKNLKPREWMDVIVVKPDPPTTAPATQPAANSSPEK